jgi:hypothetical protein
MAKKKVKKLKKPVGIAAKRNALWDIFVNLDLRAQMEFAYGGTCAMYEVAQDMINEANADGLAELEEELNAYK